MFKERCAQARCRPTAPGDADCSTRWRGRTRPTSTSSGAASIRWRRAGKLGALLAQFPPSFKDSAGVARLPRRPAARVQRTTRSPSSCGTGAGATRSATRWRCSTRSAPRGCRSTSRSSASRSGRTTCRTCGASTTCGCTAGTRRSGGGTRRPRTATTTCTRPTSCRSSRRRRTRRRQLVKKLYLYTNNHFSAKSVANAAMIKQQLGEPIEGEYPPEFVERYPELAGVVTRRRSALHSRTYIRRDHDRRAAVARARPSPAMTLAEHGVPAVQSPDGRPASRRSGCRPARGRPGAPSPTAPVDVQPLLR